MIGECSKTARESEGPLEEGKHESNAGEDMPPAEHEIILALSLSFSFVSHSMSGAAWTPARDKPVRQAAHLSFVHTHAKMHAVPSSARLHIQPSNTKHGISTCLWVAWPRVVAGETKDETCRDFLAACGCSRAFAGSAGAMTHSQEDLVYEDEKDDPACRQEIATIIPASHASVRTVEVVLSHRNSDY